MLLLLLKRPFGLCRTWAMVFCLLGSGGVVFAAPGKEVRVGVYQNEPKIFLNDQQLITGILGDLITAIGDDAGWTVRAVPCEWQACLQGLSAGTIDLMPDVAYTEERAQLYDFHKTPALLSWSQIYQREGAQIRSALDLKGKRIAVLSGSVQQDYLRNLLSGFGVSAELVPVSTLTEAFDLASRGKVDAAAANRFYGDYQYSKFRLQPTPVIFLPSQLFFTTAKGRNAELLERIELRLSGWQSQPDSRYFQVLKHWMETPPQFAVPAYVGWSLGGLAGGLALVIGAWALLRREVAEKTRSLRSSEDRLAAILNGVDAYIYIKDSELRYQYANRKVCDLFGLPLDAVIGQTDDAFFNEATASKLHANDLRVILHGERVEEEEVNRSPDGAQEHTYLSVKLPLYRPDGSIYALCGISTDITRQKQSEQAIHQLAFFDPLTHLPNRRLLMDHLQLALATQKRSEACGALLFIDVDNFKDLNDTLGHGTGDLLLTEIAARLVSCIRAQDTPARQGGDEFVALLQGLSHHLTEAMAQAQHVADKIRMHLSEPYSLGEHLYRTSVSIGVAMFTGDGVSREDILKQADLAMYQAKADGRNAVRFFNPDMQAQVTMRTVLETGLQQALVDQQFLLYYQPQVDEAGGTLGMEALVRWQHPTRGLVSPAEFIPVAESSGLILPLGVWITKTACEQLVRWAAYPETEHLSIAVNVSARQFRQSDFAQQVQAILQATGANPRRLELELTESQLLDDIEGVIKKMDALKALGVRFVLDDFGTGYSSLNVLKRLPLDQLKIDQSFVRDLTLDAQSASIVRAIVTLGDSLHLQVIAEGVETPAQRDALLALGCKHFQGYLFGRPAPMAA